MLQQVLSAEWAYHFCQKGLPASEMLRCFEYRAGQDIVRGHPDFTNVVKKVLLLSFYDGVYGDKLQENGSKADRAP